MGHSGLGSRQEDEWVVEGASLEGASESDGGSQGNVSPLNHGFADERRPEECRFFD